MLITRAGLPAAAEAIARYTVIERLLDGVVSGLADARRTENRIDAVLTHPLKKQIDEGLPYYLALEALSTLDRSAER